MGRHNSHQIGQRPQKAHRFKGGDCQTGFQAPELEVGAWVQVGSGNLDPRTVEATQLALIKAGLFPSALEGGRMITPELVAELPFILEEAGIDATLIANQPPMQY